MRGVNALEKKVRFSTVVAMTTDLEGTLWRTRKAQNMHTDSTIKMKQFIGVMGDINYKLKKERKRTLILDETRL